MNEQLKNVFVPYNVAKLAFEKGFTEWCASISLEDDKNPIPNSIMKDDDDGLLEELVFDCNYLSDDSYGEYGLPTHFQLIIWLKSKHDIDVTMQINGFWIVLDAFGRDTYFEDENEFEINQALEVALNLLPDFVHDKQEYV